MRVCPKCDYEEPLCWHYPTFHGLEMPYAKIEELREECAELAQKIERGQPIRPKVLQFIDSHYAYKYNIRSGFVRRRELSFWKAAKWGNIPMEKAKRYTKGSQKKLLDVKP